MNLKFTFLVVIFSLMFILSSGISSAVSCTVAASRTVILESDFINEQGTARTLVYGEAAGSFGSAQPEVIFDCNADNIEPKPLEKNVKARVTYSEYALSYRGDCYYPRPEKDTTYAIRGKVNGVECVYAVDLGSVKTPGSGKPSANLTLPECGKAGQKECAAGDKCKTGFVQDGYGKCTTCPSGTTIKEGRCVGDQDTKNGEDTSGLLCLDGSKPVNGECHARKKGCPEGSIEDTFTGQCYEDPHTVRPVNCPEEKVYNTAKKECVIEVKKCPAGKTYNSRKGECVGKENGDDLPRLPVEEEIFTITLTKKFTSIGMPFPNENSKIVENTCDDMKGYYYDKESNAFAPAETNKWGEAYQGRGILVKLSGDKCTIKFKGMSLAKQSFSLKKGWNFISPQTKAFQTEKNIKGNCSFLTPFVRHEGYYIKEKTMNQGMGYFVKVKSDCTLSATGSTDDELPALPEE